MVILRRQMPIARSASWRLPDEPRGWPDAMRIISKKAVVAMVLYSSAQIDRLEKAGLFPKRVRLGPARVGWLESEVQDWIKGRADDRNVYPGGIRAITDEPEDAIRIVPEIG